jgi:phosphohistidine phosphatase
MRIYLVQHGDALSKELDAQRPLSDQGRSDVGRLAFFLQAAGVRASRVLHSGKKRAEQTAAILAAAVGAGAHVEGIRGVDPTDPVSDFAPELDSWKEDTLVVGHLPFMGRLVSHLLTGGDAVTTVAFRPGSIVCLKREGSGDWAVAWMVRPELLTHPK